MGADLVIFDTPARLSDHTTGPVELADLVIIPTKTTVKDLERVKASYDLVTKIADTPTVILINQARSQGDRADQSVEFLSSMNFTVCPHSFGYRVAYEDADTTGQTPQEMDSRGKAAAEISSVYQFTIKELKKLKKKGASHAQRPSRPTAQAARG